MKLKSFWTRLDLQLISFRGDTCYMNFFENKQNRVITVVCLLIAIICAYFMQNDSLFRGSRSLSSETIGSFEQLRKDVRKKNIANYFWDDLKPKDLLIEGDSVFTGAESSVTVKLSNGQLIVVAPNSLIKFSYKGKKMVLDIPYGGVQLENVVDDIIIADCGENLDLNKDQGSISLKKSEKCGSVKIDTKSVVNAKNFEERKTKKDIATTFDEVAETGVLGQIEKFFDAASVTPTSLSAPHLENKDIKYEVSGENPQVLKWSVVDGAKSYEVDVSNTPDFIQVDPFKTNANQLTLKKLSNNMFYRVRAVGFEKAISSNSEIGQLTVTFPRIKMDKLKVTKEYKAKNPRDRGIAGTAVDVSWSKVPYADKYVIELIDKKSKKPVRKTITRELASALEVPRTGKYSYQVRALDTRGRDISSSDVGEVVYNKVFNILAPLIQEGINDKFYFFQKNAAKYVWLKWLSQSEEARKFRVEIARDKDFSAIVQSSFTAKPKLLVTEQVDAGEYFWRVRSEEGENYSSWSNTEMFKIQINNN